LKTAAKIKDLRLATKEEVKEVTRVEIGAVPPFGLIFEIPLYIDKNLFDNETIVFNAGLHTKSIQMSTDDYKRIAQGSIGVFTQ
jgi:Ala-tRNA(Pro) deacylase